MMSALAAAQRPIVRADEDRSLHRRCARRRGGLTVALACVVTVCGRASAQSPPSVNLGGEIAQSAIDLLNAPYVPGGTDIEGFDCSGLAWYIHHKLGLEVPRRAQDQGRLARRVPLSALKPGDLLFFHMKSPDVGSTADAGSTASPAIAAHPGTTSAGSLGRTDRRARASRTVDHVGIYIGGGFFIHVSGVARAVAYSRLDNRFFQEHLVGAGRFWSNPVHEHALKLAGTSVPSLVTSSAP